MKYRHRQEVDDATLQADVMRFMAIVAFCLVAILAMVRNIDDAPQTAVADAPTQSQAAVLTSQPAEGAEGGEASIDVASRTFVITRSAEVAVPADQATVDEPAHISEMRVDEAAPKAAPASMPSTEPIPSPEPIPAQDAPPVVAVSPEQRGLTLRFESESDFLRLVARGKVAVYAFDSANFVALDENYRFRQSQPPGQVYELELATIPPHLRASLPPELAAANLKWAVGLPGRVERQIEEYVANVKSGELRIDRFENVHHVAAR